MEFPVGVQMVFSDFRVRGKLLQNTSKKLQNTAEVIEKHSKGDNYLRIKLRYKEFHRKATSVLNPKCSNGCYCPWQYWIPYKTCFTDI